MTEHVAPDGSLLTLILNECLVLSGTLSLYSLTLTCHTISDCIIAYAVNRCSGFLFCKVGKPAALALAGSLIVLKVSYLVRHSTFISRGSDVYILFFCVHACKGERRNM